MVFLDAAPLIYLIEQPPTFGPRAAARIATLLGAGERLAVRHWAPPPCFAEQGELRSVVASFV